MSRPLERERRPERKDAAEVELLGCLRYFFARCKNLVAVLDSCDSVMARYGKNIASVESVERGDRTWLCLAARSPLFRSGYHIQTCCPCGLLLKSVNSTRPSTYTKRTPAAPQCATCACSIPSSFHFFNLVL